ncbi:MAG: MFS transporter [Acidimicrobiia bacterium]|nr:MFS transporter [Acidimicrobiia bacterium]
MSEPGPDAPSLDSAAAWLVAGATFLSTFTVFGVAYSFGSFFRPMAEEFDADRGTIALVFSITTLLYFGLGVVSGRAADRFGPRPVLLFGAVALVVGLVVTSRVESITVGYVTYGLGVGIGVACGYVPMVATVGGWFDRHRSTAVGLAVAGIGAGTLVVAPLAERLIDSRGWRTTYLYLAAASAVLLAVAAIGARRPPVMAGTSGPAPILQQIRSNRAFGVLYLAILGISAGLFVPFVFMADYVAEQGIDGSGGLIVGLIGLCSVVGRLGLGALAARVSPMALFYGSLATMAASYLIWLTAGDRYGQLVVFALVLGVAYGGFIALSPVVAAELFGTVGLGGVLGALYTAAGVGGFIGPPTAGALIDRFGYSPTLVATTAVSALGASTYFALARH